MTSTWSHRQRGTKITKKREGGGRIRWRGGSIVMKNNKKPH